MREQTKYGIALWLGALVAAAAITNQSLWIDEGAAALRAMQPTLRDWWQALRAEGHSNLQLLFQLLYLWGWEKIFGSSEFALRASNIPWFLAATTAMLWGFSKRPHLQLALLLLTLTNGFLWYYLSEARPYIVLFAFSALTASCLFRLREDAATSANSPLWFGLFCLGIVGICATSMIAVPWALGAMTAFAFWVGPRPALRTATRFALLSAIVGCALIGLCLYYLWTIRLGARASLVSQTSFASLGFVFYELLGLSGLGPGRLALRDGGARALMDYAPAIGLGVLAISALSVAALNELRRKTTRRDFIFFAIALGVPVVLVLLAGVIAHMRLLGRHFTPILPFLLVFLAVGLGRLLFARQVLVRTGAVAAIAALLISALEIRFAPRHQRDDYRSAANVARAALEAGRKVWWVADEPTGAYYNLPLNSPNLTLGPNLAAGPLDILPTPDLVCFSKPDIYDLHGRIDNYLREHDFKVSRVLPAFQIFERQPARP